MEWRGSDTKADLCRVLNVTLSDFEAAERESDFNYIELPDHRDKKSGKVRPLCYPPDGSILRKVQTAIKDRILSTVDIAPHVQGYRKGSHNILVADRLALLPYVGNLDISRFHPSISHNRVLMALKKHGLSFRWARWIANLVTFKGYLPQGAPTSNHAANLVIDSLLKRWVLPYAAGRGVMLINYGDDIAFGHSNREIVKQTAAYLKKVIHRAGFEVNNKGKDCEQRGGARLFLGTRTGGTSADFPRGRYRQLRKQLRTALHRERESPNGAPVTTIEQVRSFRHKIVYIARLNPHKARRLKDVYYRLHQARYQKSQAVRLAKLAAYASAPLRPTESTASAPF